MADLIPDAHLDQIADPHVCGDGPAYVLCSNSHNDLTTWGTNDLARELKACRAALRGLLMLVPDAAVAVPEPDPAKPFDGKVEMHNLHRVKMARACLPEHEES